MLRKYISFKAIFELIHIQFVLHDYSGLDSAYLTWGFSLRQQLDLPLNLMEWKSFFQDSAHPKWAESPLEVLVILQTVEHWEVLAAWLMPFSQVPQFMWDKSNYNLV